MRWFALLALMSFASTTALAIDRGLDRGGEVRDEVTQREFGTGLNPVDRGEFTFKGTVYDRARSPMPGVDLKLFIGGLLEAEYRTDSVGQYDFKHVVDFSRDESVTLWFVDPSFTTAPKVFVLKESQLSLDHGVFGACVTRVQVEKTMESTVYLLDRATKAKQLTNKGCL